jgi:hypothetical protein
MVRANKTLKPQTPGLEAGAAYGEVSDSLAAQDSIPLQQGGMMAAPPQANAPAFEGPAPMRNPMEAAAAYTPQVTPLTAQGTGVGVGMGRPAPTPNQESAEMLRNWAEAVNEPAFIDAAIQLGQ